MRTNCEERAHWNKEVIAGLVTTPRTRCSGLPSSCPVLYCVAKLTPDSLLESQFRLNLRPFSFVNPYPHPTPAPSPELTTGQQDERATISMLWREGQVQPHRTHTHIYIYICMYICTVTHPSPVPDSRAELLILKQSCS